MRNMTGRKINMIISYPKLSLKLMEKLDFSTVELKETYTC